MKGAIVQKTPFALELEAGKTYYEATTATSSREIAPRRNGPPLSTSLHVRVTIAKYVSSILDPMLLGAKT
jgi:hypothetical protein